MLNCPDKQRATTPGGLSGARVCLALSFVEPNRLDRQQNQIDQITATRREMAPDTFSSRAQRESTDWAVQDIVGEFSSSKARSAWHGPLASLSSGGFWIWR